jgi:hypothetical protein
MARRVRQGLDYFPLETSWDLNMRLLKAEYKAEGVGIIIFLRQMIYREGYFLTWDSEIKQLFCLENDVEVTKLDKLIESCFKRGIFDRGMFDKCAVLTSQEIQRQWIKICVDAKRKNSRINPDLNLCTEEEVPSDSTKLSEKLRKHSEKTRGNSGNIAGNSRNTGEDSGNHRESSEERKGKESKEKEIKLKKNKEKEIKEKITTPVEKPRTFTSTAPSEEQGDNVATLINALAVAKRVPRISRQEAKESFSQRFQRMLVEKGIATKHD